MPFDPKKKFRGGTISNIKTVKGGFKPEKVEKKPFFLDIVKNPFEIDSNEDSSSS